MSSLEAARQVLETVLDKMSIDAQIGEAELNDKEILTISSDDQKLLIGKGGENLRALEYLVNSLARKQVEDYQYVVIDVADYKKEKEDRLIRMATEAADAATEKGRVIRLKPMNSYERRIVHTALADRSDIETASEGEEPYRKIVVRARP